MPEINTFIFLDLEATGLQGIGEKPRITELSMVATHRLALLDMAAGYPHKPPRVMDKLTLCMYPMKPVTPGAAAMTGLYNDNLLHKKDFDETLAQSVNLFIERQEPPVCLMAHNGLRYDYPLLKAELQALGLSLPEGVWCADSLPMLKELDAEAEAEKQRQEEILLRNQETPSGPVRRIERTSSLGFESSGIPEERMRTVKRKLFDDDPGAQKKVASDKKDSDENANVVGEKSDPVVFTLSESQGSSISTGAATKEHKVISISSVDSQLSQSSSASTIICGMQDSQSMADVFDQHQSLEEAVHFAAEESTSEETTPAKSASLIQKLSCTESISEDSGSDMELGKIVLQKTTTWSSTLTDDILLGVDLDAAVQEYHQQESKSNRDGLGKTPDENSTEVSSITEQELESKLSCPEEKLQDSPLRVSNHPPLSQQHQATTSVHVLLPTTSVQNPLPAMSIQAPAPVPATAPLSKLEACRRNLQLQVANVRNMAPVLPAAPRSSAFSTPGVSYKLGDVYQRLFKSVPTASHRAEDDCITLLLICQKTGEKMARWCDENATLFGSVEAMYEARGRTPLKPGIFPHH